MGSWDSSFPIDNWKNNGYIIAVINFWCPQKMKKNRKINFVFFDFLYIKDLTNIVEWFMLNEPNHKVYNICTGNVHDYQTIAEKICQISGKDVEIRTECSDFNTEYSVDNTELLKEIPDYEFTPMEEYLERIYRWTIRNRGSINPAEFQ